MLEKLLFEPNSQKTNPKFTKNQENFILNLIKETPIKEIPQLLKTFNISKEELIKLFEKAKTENIKLPKIEDVLKQIQLNNFEEKKQKNFIQKENSELKEILPQILNSLQDGHFKNSNKKEVLQNPIRTIKEVLLQKQTVKSLNLNEKEIKEIENADSIEKLENILKNSKNIIENPKQIKYLKNIIIQNKEKLNLREKEIKEIQHSSSLKQILKLIQNALNEILPDDHFKNSNKKEVLQNPIRTIKEVILQKQTVKSLNLNEKEIKEIENADSIEKLENILKNSKNIIENPKQIKYLKNIIIQNKEKLNLTQEETVQIQLSFSIEQIFKTIQKSLNQTSLTTAKPSNALNILKEILLQKQTVKKLNLSQKDTEEIKNADSIEKLIEFANKKELNLKKIVLSQIKEKPKNNLNVSKLEIPSQILLTHSKNIKKHEEFKQTKNIENKTISQNSFSLKDLLTKEIKKENIKTAPSDKISDNLKKEEPNNHINHFTPTQKTVQVKQQVIKAKQTFTHFANNLKEAIENYKPPLSKISMELNPKELGKVEVTLIHRGEKLQIQINSSHQTMQFFQINQNELKSALVNMGYSDVNMSFNSNQQQNQNQKEYRQNQKLKKQDEEELIIEIPYQYA
ncbi:flagellar hook-length control protein FliK [Caminibacter sp.]